MNSKSLSKLNKSLDSLQFDRYKKLRKIISNIEKNSSFYDYGEGYFYQSLSKINLRGLRNSKYRKDILKIERFSKNKSILDIGTNTGFLLMEMENNFKNCLGIDHNPSLIEIANIVKNNLGISNINFLCKSIYDFDLDKKFDIVLSLANHSTFDKGVEDTKKYFEKILKLIQTKGLLIIESHHPDYENLEEFEKISKNLLENYSLLEEGFYNIKNYYDNKRKYLILQLKK